VTNVRSDTMTSHARPCMVGACTSTSRLAKGEKGGEPRHTAAVWRGGMAVSRTAQVSAGRLGHGGSDWGRCPAVALGSLAGWCVQVLWRRAGWLRELWRQPRLPAWPHCVGSLLSCVLCACSHPHGSRPPNTTLVVCGGCEAADVTWVAQKACSMACSRSL